MSDAPPKRSFLKALFSKNMLICVFNGFTAGLRLANNLHILFTVQQVPQALAKHMVVIRQ